jgi:hypothetical protein
MEAKTNEYKITVMFSNGREATETVQMTDRDKHAYLISLHNKTGVRSIACERLK